MSVKEYQIQLIPRCERRFRRHEIVNEWGAFSGLPYQYSPRVDIAIGPFNIGPGPNIQNRYNELVRSQRIRSFIERAIEMNNVNVDRELYINTGHANYNSVISGNRNARCLIALEIENTNSKKHMMGSIVNAASLGRVGIGIAYCDSALRTFLRIVNYLNFLRSVGKNTYNTQNFLILSVGQFDRLIRSR